MMQREPRNGPPRPYTQGGGVRGEGFFALLMALALTGCHAPAAETQVIEGQYLGATAHQIQIEIEKPGQLSNQLALPMDPHLKVTKAGETIPLGKLPTGAPVRVTRDIDSHMVTRIDAK